MDASRPEWLSYIRVEHRPGTPSGPRARGLMGSACAALIDGRLFNLLEHPAPLALIEAWGFETFETIPPPELFPLFVHDLECTADGLAGVVVWPVGDGAFWEARGGWGLRLIGWADWLRADGMFFGGMRGLGAWHAFVRFRAWAAPLTAEGVIALHGEHGGPLGSYVERFPDIASDPALRSYAADLGLGGGKRRGRGKRGPAVDTRRAVLELAALAGVIRARDGLSSWLLAYEAACRERPGWVPASWSDPAGRLEKEVAKLKGTCWEGIRNLA